MAAEPATPAAKMRARDDDDDEVVDDAVDRVRREAIGAIARSA